MKGGAGKTMEESREKDFALKSAAPDLTPAGFMAGMSTLRDFCGKSSYFCGFAPPWMHRKSRSP